MNKIIRAFGRQTGEVLQFLSFVNTKSKSNQLNKHGTNNEDWL